MKHILSLFLGILSLSAQSQVTGKKADAIQGIDMSKKPGNNFFSYINSKWYDTAQIPVSQSGVGAYMFMNYPQRLRLQGILETVSKTSNTPGSIGQQLGDFYAAGMDTATINKLGYDPVEPTLNTIDNIHDVKSLTEFAAAAIKVNNASIFSFSIGPDNKNSSMNIAHAYQTGINLPERDYYFKTDSSTIAIQEAYKKYLAVLLKLTGTDSSMASKNAELVYGIEKRIATSHRTNVELRDVNANYNKISVTELVRRQPNINWLKMLTILGAKTDSIDIGQPAYYDSLNVLLTSVPVTDWKVYLKAFTLATYADQLSKPFSDAAFEFNRVMTGQAVQKTRGEIMAQVVDGTLGEALGQLYVQKYFTNTAKKRALELVNNLQKAFSARMEGLDWMSAATKQKAKEKLFAITKKIGYPDKWRDYHNVHINRTTYFENLRSAASNNYEYQLAKLGKTVDRSEWFITPSTVTAYYNPAANEIVFPAAILQSPYFDEEADDALNFVKSSLVHQLETLPYLSNCAPWSSKACVISWPMTMPMPP